MSDTTDTRTLGPREVVERLLAVIDAHPQQVNPEDATGCVYTHPTDPTYHCLAGQLAADSGWTVPGPEEEGYVEEVWHRFGWPLSEEGATALGRAQFLADRGTPEWGTIRDQVAALAEVSG